MNEIIIERSPVTNRTERRVDIRGNMLTLIIYILKWYIDNYNLLAYDFVIRKDGSVEDIIKCIPIYENFYKKPTSTLNGGRAIIMSPDKKLYILYRKFIDKDTPDRWETTRRRISLSEAIVKEGLNLNKLIGQLKDNINNRQYNLPIYFDALDIVMKGIAYEIEYESLITLNYDDIDTAYEQVI